MRKKLEKKISSVTNPMRPLSARRPQRLISNRAKNKNNSGDEIRHLGVLVEDVRDEVKLIAEQYGDIKSDIGIIKNKLEEHSRILEVHSIILQEHTEILGSIKADIEIIKNDIEFIKYSLKKKVDIEEFSALERRVALLEKRH